MIISPSAIAALRAVAVMGQDNKSAEVAVAQKLAEAISASDSWDLLAWRNWRYEMKQLTRLEQKDGQNNGQYQQN